MVSDVEADLDEAREQIEAAREQLRLDPIELLRLARLYDQPITAFLDDSLLDMARQQA